MLSHQIHKALFKPQKNLFVAFLGLNHFRRVGLRFVCWFLYDGNTQRLTESGFMEKPGIEPATPGLKDIGLSPTPRRLLVLTTFLWLSWV